MCGNDEVIPSRRRGISIGLREALRLHCAPLRATAQVFPIRRRGISISPWEALRLRSGQVHHCVVLLLTSLLLAPPLYADTIEEFQKARRDKIMRELEMKSGKDPRAVLQNVQPTTQEVIPVYKGSYGSANNSRDRYVLLAYERKVLEARLNDILPGGWQVIEIGLSYAKIQKGGVTRFLDVKLPTNTFPRGLNPSIFQPIN